jgi:DNA-binding transcriptional LysR family regulator
LELEDLRAFVAVVETGSVVAAAKLLGRSRSRVRRSVETMEVMSGTSLLHRTPSGAAPTEAGRELQRDGRRILSDADDLMNRIRDEGALPRGVLRIAAPPGMPLETTAVVVSFLRANFPDVRLHLDTSLHAERLLPEQADVALVLGGRPGKDSDVRFVLRQVPVRLLASPLWLERFGPVHSLDDLEGHALFSWTSPDWEPDAVPLRSGGQLRVLPAVTFANIVDLRHCAEQGLCVAFAPDPIPGPSLVPVLPDVVGADLPLCLVFPAAVARLPKVRAMIELARGLAGSLSPVER